MFASGVTLVPLTTGATIIDARLGTTSLALTREGEMNAALVEGPRAVLDHGGMGRAGASTPGRASLAVPAPMTGAVTRRRSSSRYGQRRANRAQAPSLEQPQARAAREWKRRWSRQPRRACRGPPSACEATTPREARTVADVKSLVSLRDAELRVTSLVEVSVLAGQPDRIEMTVPEGFVFEGASGGTVEPAGAS